MDISVYDTTLRDGTQGEGVSYSVEDKLLIARKLDELGIDYIEGGWPGSNGKDQEFFDRARSLNLSHARVAAFGSTCHPRCSVEEDINLRMLLAAETPVVTIFGKSWELHVNKALGISLEENLALIEKSVRYLKSAGREVVYDAEHFFDGFASHPDYAVETVLAAERGGAGTIVLCDTNGGTLPGRLSEVVSIVRRRLGVAIGIHTHNDSDLAVANSLAAVECGATHVQGTINGYGERCGNANLCSLIPLLELKAGHQTIGRERIGMLTQVSRVVAELANLPQRPDLPFVGRSAFAHKGGVHVSAVMREPATYEHIDPEITGNRRRVLVSDLSGKSNVLYKAAEMGIDISGGEGRLKPLVKRIKELEHQGFQFEAAEGSLRLMLEHEIGGVREYFTIDHYKVTAGRDSAGKLVCDAYVRVQLGDRFSDGSANGCGPVHALDLALRRALADTFECLGSANLTDYKVRVLDTDKATAAKVRVLIQTRDLDESWSTVGVSDNILEASLQALSDAINYKLLKTYGSSAGIGARDAVETGR